MKINSSFCSAVCCSVAIAVHGTSNMSLIGDDGQTATVVLPTNSDEATKLAATELTNYVFKITGRGMPVVTRGKATKNSPEVVIGTIKTLSDVPQSIRERLDATDNPEAACMATDGRTLWIVGKDEVADLYATYHFLESKLGVRWFQAETNEDPGDYVPKATSVKIAPFSEFREPRFRIRRLDKCSATMLPLSVKAETCAVRNGYQVFPQFDDAFLSACDKPDSELYKFYAPRCPRRSVSFGGGHVAFSQPMPVKTTFKKHPEYFALVDGKRVPGELYCFSNPEVQSNVANRVIGLLDRHHGNGEFLFGMADVTHGWCECDRCRALDPVPANGSQTPNVSTRFNIAVKNMAGMIWAKWPNADLRMWAYHTYRILPVGVRQDPRMMVWFCDHGRCYGHHLDDPSCARNVEMLRLLKGWLKVTPRVYTYEYFTCSDSPYSCHEKDEAHDIRLYAKLGLVGWKNEASFSDSQFWPPSKNKVEDVRADRFPSTWQWLYVTSKLLWDPYQDEDAILEDAESKYYGAAYPAMKKYHALRRKLWANNRNCMGYPTGDQRRPALLDVHGAKDALLAQLDKADRLAAGDPVVAFRVGRDRKWLARYWIKPNERLKAKAGKAFRAVRATTPVVVDGRGGEGAWAGAYYTDKLYSTDCGKREVAIDASLATSFGILYDDDNLYFLIKAKEPEMPAILPKNNGPAWEGDGIEIFLYPPEIDNRYYQVAVNPDGKTYEGVHPAGRGSANFGVKAAGRAVKDGWQLEIKIPTGKMHALKAGETWRVLLCRNRVRRGKNLADSYSSDACGCHDTISYHPMEIGSTYLKNGSFSDLDNNGNPAGWEINGKATKIVPSGSGNAVVLNGSIYQTMAHGALGQKPEPRRLRYEFMAKGPGKVAVAFYRYADTPNPKSKNGYDRKFIPDAGKGGSFTLADKAAMYSGEYEISPGEWNSIALHSGDGVTVYSVSVTPLKSGSGKQRPGEGEESK